MHEKVDSKLIGRWVTDPDDTTAINEFGRTTLVFSDDGKLTYIIHNKNQDQIILMTYKIDGAVLVTDQPSQREEERTGFTVTADGKLVLDYDGIKSTYVRVSD